MAMKKSRHLLLINYLVASTEARFLLLEKGYFFTENEIWESLLYEFDLTDIPTEILFKELSTSEIVDIVIKQRSGEGELLGQVSIAESIIPDSLSSDVLIKAIVKSIGEIWEIHKTDIDDFPSLPHAHNYRSGLSLDLRNGLLYKKRKQVEKIRYKDLVSLRGKIAEQYPEIVLPNLEII